MKLFLTSLFLLSSFLIGISSVCAEEVLVVTWRGKTAAEKGFEEKLKELRSTVKFRYIDAGRNKSRLDNLLKNTDLSSVDLVYSFGTTGSRIVKSYLKGRIPQIFNIVSTPVKSRLVKSLQVPGNNLTGAKLLVDIETQFDLLLKLKAIKNIGVWYDPREQQGATVLSRIGAYAKKHDLDIVPYRIIPDADQNKFGHMMEVAIQKAQQFDALYIVPTSSFFSIRKNYLSRIPSSLLVMSGIEGYVGEGATLSLAADYGERGEAAAKLANKVLSGMPAGRLAVSQVQPKSVFLYVDKERIKKAELEKVYNLGLKIIER